VCIELWEARSMYQVMRGPCTGSRADNDDDFTCEDEGLLQWARIFDDKIILGKTSRSGRGAPSIYSMFMDATEVI
jgi:hypothetical protein